MSGRDPYLTMLELIRLEALGQVPLHVCEGEVLDFGPGILKVRADGHDLDEKDLMLCDTLRYDYEEDMEVELAGENLGGSAVWPGLAACGYGAHSSFRLDAPIRGGYKARVTCRPAEPRLKAGDKVLLIPTPDRQKYYLLMKVVSPLDSLPADPTAGDPA